MSRFGGGGAKCVVCNKTSYPAETITYEKKPYHADCFRCMECNKKMEGASKAAQFVDPETEEAKLLCTACFSKGGYAQKQKKTQWVQKEKSAPSAIASKFGGGGVKCKVCAKTVYAAETVVFEKASYHPACFKCSVCTKQMTPAGSAIHEDTLYCLKCFQEQNIRQKQATTRSTGTGTTNALASRFGGGGTKCVVCAKTVFAAEAVSFDKQSYHPGCFRCKVCTKQMTPADGAKYDNELYCTKCFQEQGLHRKQATEAKKPIKTTTTNALASRFGGGGTKCFKCSKTVYPAELISYEKQAYHSNCFTCTNCNIKISVSTAQGKKRGDGTVDVYCVKCWQELGLARADSTN